MAHKIILIEDFITRYDTSIKNNLFYSSEQFFVLKFNFAFK